MAGGVAHSAKLLGQLADALARPSQGRIRVASRHRVDQPLQIGAERGVGLHGLLATASGASDTARAQVVGGLRLVKARGEGTPRDPRGAGDSGDAAATNGGRL